MVREKTNTKLVLEQLPLKTGNKTSNIYIRKDVTIRQARVQMMMFRDINYEIKK